MTACNMNNEKIIKGSVGEELTCNYLMSRGYRIAARNYRSKFGEIDIIACNERCIAFVEVKTRNKNPLNRPCMAVNRSKRMKIMKTAYMYLQENKVNLMPRFDISEVYLMNNTHRLHHIDYMEGAFIQEGDYAYF